MNGMSGKGLTGERRAESSSWEGMAVQSKNGRSQCGEGEELGSGQKRKGRSGTLLRCVHP